MGRSCRRVEERGEIVAPKLKPEKTVKSKRRSRRRLKLQRRRVLPNPVRVDPAMVSAVAITGDSRPAIWHRHEALGFWSLTITTGCLEREANGGYFCTCKRQNSTASRNWLGSSVTSPSHP
ncbi:hypothetical protein TIFTF001_008336 [Ficus carica]|uniref:Uncharacterized protein n=1 Tax=Ficus carica TaxID=3494 RepID=A0AA88A4N0_FICCA|nr:hypothetical protein TIFTF001_008336 [Ficus carica]